MNGAAKLKEWHSGDRFVIDDKNTIYRHWEFGKFAADGFIDAATNAIATNSGFEDLFGNDDSETLIAASIWHGNKRK